LVILKQGGHYCL